MHVGKKSSSDDKKYPPGSFMGRLKERKIIATLVAFAGSGVVIIELAHHILVNHYHFPHQIVDFCIVTIAGALIGTLTWRWFRGAEKRPGNVKVEVLVVPLIILLILVIDLKLIFVMTGIQINMLLIGIVAICLGIAWVIFKLLQWAASVPESEKRIDVVKPMEEKLITFPEWKNSIAVLPFTNISADPEQEYFCEGLSEELINALTQIKDLRVVARTSAFSFKEKEIDVREIGRKLNVDAVLEGSVRKADKRLRITAQLVNVEDGYHLWSERFDREMADIFAIQDEISLAITDRMRLKLLGEDKARLTKRSTESFEAYNLYLRGLHFRRKLTYDSIQKSVYYFKRVIEIDPENALAYAGLAYSYMVLIFYASVPYKESYPKAKKAAMKALELDDQLVEVHESLSAIKAYLEWDWEGGKRECQRMIELNPGYPWGYFHLAMIFMHHAKYDDCLREYRRALELDPLNVAGHRNLGIAYFRAGQLEKAEETLKRTIEMDPSFLYTHLNLGYVYMLKNKHEEALAEIQNEPISSRAILEPHTGIVYARMGKKEEARKILNKYTELSKKEFTPHYFLGLLCFALEENDLGFQWLEKAFEEHDPWMLVLKIDFLLDSVRENPRFKILLKKMNLE
jgi:adenylate cyclase